LKKFYHFFIKRNEGKQIKYRKLRNVQSKMQFNSTQKQQTKRAIST